MLVNPRQRRSAYASFFDLGRGVVNQLPGRPTTVQIMVKDSKKYASTGGWGFGRFMDGKPVDEAQHKTCFACHAANVKGHDLVFTRYAP